MAAITFIHPSSATHVRYLITLPSNLETGYDFCAFDEAEAIYAYSLMWKAGAVNNADITVIAPIPSESAKMAARARRRSLPRPRRANRKSRNRLSTRNFPAEFADRSFVSIDLSPQ